MKLKILFLLALLPSITMAREIPMPFNICKGFACPPAMKEISDEFARAGAIDLSQLPMVASGDCYHRAYFYNPETRHHGYILFDPKDGQIYTGGGYGFFFQENPYANYTVEMARSKNTELYADNHRVILAPTFAFADMNPGANVDARVLYWYRQTPEHTYVLGAWGTAQTFVCRLQKNQ